MPEHRLHDIGEREPEDRNKERPERPAPLRIAISIGKDRRRQKDCWRNRETREASLVQKHRAVEAPRRRHKCCIHRDRLNPRYDGVSSATNATVDHARDHVRAASRRYRAERWFRSRRSPRTSSRQAGGTSHQAMASLILDGPDSISDAFPLLLRHFPRFRQPRPRLAWR